MSSTIVTRSHTKEDLAKSKTRSTLENINVLAMSTNLTQLGAAALPHDPPPQLSSPLLKGTVSLKGMGKVNQEEINKEDEEDLRRGFTPVLVQPIIQRHCKDLDDQEDEQ